MVRLLSCGKRSRMYKTFGVGIIIYSDAAYPSNFNFGV